MQKIFITILTIFMSLQIFAAAKVSGGISHQMPDWFKQSFLEIKEDIAEANDENKHLMLFLHLNDCPYCSQMVDDLTHIKDKITKDFDVIAINIKGGKEVVLNDMETMTEQQLAQRLGVKYTPTIVFLDKDNNIVARTNGYRKPQDFKLVRDFVKTKSYKTSNFTTYKSNLAKGGDYKFIKESNFKNITDLSSVNGLLAVVFESKDCTSCEYFHQNTLQNQLVKNEFKPYTIVRVDANSNGKIITPNGKKTTIKNFVQDLEMFYRPGIVLFRNGEEKGRVDGFLYSWHFSEILRFVANKLDEKYQFGQYLGLRQQELLKQGIDINIAN